MIVVTGGAGFIGSNIVKGLNDLGYDNILVVDDLTDGTKFRNIVDLSIADYIDKDDFLDLIISDRFSNSIKTIFHQGACSATTEWDGKFLMQNNYEYSKELLHYCLERRIPFLYASSAAVYGAKDKNFFEDNEFEKPLNMYGYSKYLFDQYVCSVGPKTDSLVCGFRYFNVYGPRESHKGKMASVAFHLHQQILKGEDPKLFTGSETFLRDFIYVEDVVKVNLWFWFNQRASGVFNCGTGRAESFKTVADSVIKFHQRGKIEHVPFPQELKGSYQAFTQADISRLREVGFDDKFKTVEEGINLYLTWLSSQ